MKAISRHDVYRRSAQSLDMLAHPAELDQAERRVGVLEERIHTAALVGFIARGRTKRVQRLHSICTTFSRGLAEPIEYVLPVDRFLASGEVWGRGGSWLIVGGPFPKGLLQVVERLCAGVLRQSAEHAVAGTFVQTTCTLVSRFEVDAVTALVSRQLLCRR